MCRSVVSRNDWSASRARIAGLAVIALIAVVNGDAARAVTFTNLGTLPGGSSSYAFGISDDGSEVVGSAQSAGGERGFRWTSSSGTMTSIGTLAGDDYSSAYGVSGDGTVVVGRSGLSSGTATAIRWTAASGTMQSLGLLSGGDFSEAKDVSADGSVLVGGSGTLSGGNFQAFRWTTTSGSMQALGTLPGDATSFAYGVSGDGAVVVGQSFGSQESAVRWNVASGTMQNLGSLGGPGGRAVATNGDGSVVVGYANASGTASEIRAFRWTSASGTMQNLGTLPGGNYSFASGVSADGSAIVGLSTDSNFDDRAFLWTSDNGMVDLNTYLAGLGVDLAGWDLMDAVAITPDGDAITGYGTFNGNDAAWLVTGVAPVPEPSTTALALAGIACGGFSMWRRRKRV